MQIAQARLAFLLLSLSLALAAPSARAQCPRVASIAAQGQTCAIRVTWTHDPATPAPTSWNIFRNSTASIAGAVLIDTRGPNTFEFVDSVANVGVPRFYFVRGVNAACPAGPESEIVGALASQQIVQNVRVQSATCNSLTLAWDALPGATEYRVFRSIGFSATSLATLGPGVTTFTDSTGVPNTDYTYSVFASTACFVGTGANGLSLRFPAPPAPAFPLPTVVASEGTSGAFNLRFTGDLPALNPTFQWLKDGQPLQLGGRFTASGSILTIDPILVEDVGFYVLEITTNCGTARQTLLLAVRPLPCRADFNRSGTISVQDVFDFLSAWFAGCP